MVRRRTPVLLQVYLPSGLFVIVSWISFIVPPEVVPGKVSSVPSLLSSPGRVPGNSPPTLSIYCLLPSSIVKNIHFNFGKLFSKILSELSECRVTLLYVFSSFSNTLLAARLPPLHPLSPLIDTILITKFYCLQQHVALQPER